MLFISCKQCYVANKHRYQPDIGHFYLKVSVLDRLVKTGIGASLVYAVPLKVSYDE